MNLLLLDASVFLAAEDSDDLYYEDSRKLFKASTPLASLDLVLYEVTNVAICSWKDPVACHRLLERVKAVAEDGGLVHATTALMASSARIAEEKGISVYDAAYVAASDYLGGHLVSCDVRDLVSKGLARLPNSTNIVIN